MIGRRCIAVILTLLVCGGCRGTSPDSAGDVPYVRLADSDDVPTLDPAHGYDTRSWQFEEMLFDTLVDYNDDGVIVSELADGWEPSADGLTYLFHMRDGVRFTNGRAMTAADVRYSIERIVDPRTASIGAEFFRGIIGADECTEMEPCRIPGIETEGTRTVRFRLSAFDPIFLHKLTMPFAAVVPREEVSRWGEDFGRHPVGTGPFKLREWAAGRRVSVIRNEDYFLPEIPRVPAIELQVGVSDEMAWLKYASGALDAFELQASEVPRVKKDSRHEALMREVTTMRTSYVGMNCLIAPFDDVRVRRAMNYAVNKDKVVRLIYGTGVAARGVLPPNMPGHEEGRAGYAYDPARARRLLAEAGYGEGFESTLWVRSSPDSLQVAQGIQQDLRDVGIGVTIKAVAWGALLEAVRSRRLVPLFLLGWEADFPDPSNFLEVLFHSRNIGSNNNTQYSNAQLDRLLDEAATVRDQTERFKLLRRAEKMIVDDAPWVFLYHPVTHYVIAPRLRGFRLHPFRPPRYQNVWLAESPPE